MRRSTKKKVIPLALALALALIGATLAVPLISVNVQDIGTGSGDVVNPISYANFTWNLGTNPDILNSIVVNITLKSPYTSLPTGGKLYIKFYDDSDNLAYMYTITDTGTLTFTQASSGDYYTVISIDTLTGQGTYTSVSLPTALEDVIKNIGSVAVVYQGPAP